MIRAFLLCSLLWAPLASGAEPLPLKSGQYHVELTHEAEGPIRGFDLAGVKYRKLEKPDHLELKFSKDREKVEVQPGKISGSLTKSSPKKRTYRLTEGLFAGGELTIEKSKDGYVVVLTEFGSGVPVISSSKGAFKLAVLKEMENLKTKKTK